MQSEISSYIRPCMVLLVLGLKFSLETKLNFSPYPDWW
jgi:hypothetical protein